MYFNRTIAGFLLGLSLLASPFSHSATANRFDPEVEILIKAMVALGEENEAEFVRLLSGEALERFGSDKGIAELRSRVGAQQLKLLGQSTERSDDDMISFLYEIGAVDQAPRLKGTIGIAMSAPEKGTIGIARQFGRVEVSCSTSKECTIVDIDLY